MRTPREFRYWEQRDRPLFRSLRALGRAVGVELAPPDEVVETFAAMYYDADPLAEAFVDEVYLTRGAAVGRAMLDRALAEGVASVPDAPRSLVALFEDLERDPAWLDPELVELGARTFRRYGTAVFRFAGAITLMAYAENSVAKPLALTGAYAGASTRGRFLETAAFWVDISEPFGTRPGAPGRAVALRVRLMHVFVRRRLLAHPEWRLEDWGVPINQGDALLTLMGGSVAPGLALGLLGYRTSRREIEAMMHFWRYVGHLMGVRPRWVPNTIEEALSLLYVTVVKGSHGAGEDGRRLCQSFVDTFRETGGASLSERLEAALEDGVHRGYTRLFTPPWTYREMQLPRAGLWTLAPLAGFPFVFAAETLRRAFPAQLEPIADRRARARRRRWLERKLPARAAEYRAVEQFTR